MKILLYSISSPPEKTGIGKYNTEMVNFLQEKGHEITYLTTMPYYPEWEVHSDYSGKFSTTEKKQNLTIKRVWSYLPSKKVNSLDRVLKEISFHFLSLFSLISLKIKGYNPDVILCVAPPFFLPLGVRLLFKKVKIVYHIQDLEVDAAVELGMIPSFLELSLRKVEYHILKNSDLITTISLGMKKKISAKGINKEIALFPNWSDISKIYPEKSTWLHSHLNIEHSKRLIVYSGNIGNKQGLEILPEVILKVSDKFKDVHFVILGEGVYKRGLTNLLSNISEDLYTISGLVEFEDLNRMLNSSYIQLVLQKAEGSDSFMPSKLTNILAAGIPSVVTANKGSGLFEVIVNNEMALTCGQEPEDLVQKIIFLLKDSTMYENISKNAHTYALGKINMVSILNKFESDLEALI